MRVEITFGLQYDRDNRTIDSFDRDKALFTIRRAAVADFGGYTLIDHVGGWINPAGQLVEEVSATIRLDFVNDLTKAERYAKYIKRLLNQSAVVLATYATESRMID